MTGKKKKINTEQFNYSKNESFENFEVVQKMALNRKGKDDEINPDISTFLKAEELKGKLCGLYSDKISQNTDVKIMGSVKINGKELRLKTGEEINLDKKDD